MCLKNKKCVLEDLSLKNYLKKLCLKNCLKMPCLIIQIVLKFCSLNRYTADKKSSLHGWRGACAPFRPAQLLGAIEMF